MQEEIGSKARAKIVSQTLNKPEITSRFLQQMVGNAQILNSTRFVTSSSETKKSTFKGENARDNRGTISSTNIQANMYPPSSLDLKDPTLSNKIIKSLKFYQSQQVKLKSLITVGLWVHKKVANIFSNAFREIKNANTGMIFKGQLDPEEREQMQSIGRGIEIQDLDMLGIWINEFQDQDENNQRILIQELQQQYIFQEHQIQTGIVSISNILHNQVKIVFVESFFSLKCWKKKNISEISSLDKIVIRNYVQILQRYCSEIMQISFGKIRNWEVSNSINLLQLSDQLRQKGCRLVKVRASLQNSLMLCGKPFFWKWYFNATLKGLVLMKDVADRLVLYTNINRVTAFYRLTQLTELKGRVKINPRLKVLIILLHTITSNAVYPKLTHFFTQTKQAISTNQQANLRSLLERVKLKKYRAFGIWLKKIKLLMIKDQKQAQSRAQNIKASNETLAFHLHKLMQLLENKRQKTIQRTFQAIKNNRWFPLQKEKKIPAIKSLEEMIRKGTIIRIIIKFKQNASTQKTKHNFLESLVDKKMRKRGFNAIQSLPGRIIESKTLKNKQENPTDLSRGVQLLRSLQKFRMRILRASFSPFLTLLLQGRYTKYNKLAHVCDEFQKTKLVAIRKWLEMSRETTKQDRQSDKIRQISEVFGIINKVCMLNWKFLLLAKCRPSSENNKQPESYSRSQSHQYIQKSKPSREKQISQNENNHWFRRSTRILSLNSRINDQNALWRLRYHAETLVNNDRNHRVSVVSCVRSTGSLKVSVESSINMKIKNRSRCIEMKPMRYNLDRKLNNRKQQWEQKYTTFMNRIQTNASSLIFNLLLTSIKNKMQYSINLFKQISINRKNRIYRINSSFHSTTSHNSIKFHQSKIKFTSNIDPPYKSNITRDPKLSSCITIIFILNKKILTLKNTIFLKLFHASMQKRQTELYEKKIEENLQLMNSRNTLLSQIKRYQYVNQNLEATNQQKQAILQQTEVSLQLLKIKIGLITLNKFVDIVERVYEVRIMKNYDDAFDRIVEEANSNLEYDSY